MLHQWNISSEFTGITPTFGHDPLWSWFLAHISVSLHDDLRGDERREHGGGHLRRDLP
ncbi:hypothetical protein KSC_018850 [Ktedonobacter sp. SOSP1-52]|nr:hypothetical protein KSC_018850 [Ktedonobacter sp. SOSP1-52]